MYSALAAVSVCRRGRRRIGPRPMDASAEPHDRGYLEFHALRCVAIAGDDKTALAVRGDPVDLDSRRPCVHDQPAFSRRRPQILQAGERDAFDSVAAIGELRRAARRRPFSDSPTAVKVDPFGYFVISSRPSSHRKLATSSAASRRSSCVTRALIVSVFQDLEVGRGLAEIPRPVGSKVVEGVLRLTTLGHRDRFPAPGVWRYSRRMPVGNPHDYHHSARFQPSGRRGTPGSRCKGVSACRPRPAAAPRSGPRSRRASLTRRSARGCTHCHRETLLESPQMSEVNRHPVVFGVVDRDSIKVRGPTLGGWCMLARTMAGCWEVCMA